MKCQISYSRKVQTIPYENIAINYSREYDDELEDKYEAFREVRDFVNDMLEDEFARLRIQRRGSL